MARHLGRIRSLERQYAHEIAEVALDNFLEFVDYNWYRHAAYNRGDGRAFVQMSGVLDTGLEGIYKVADYLDRGAAERRFPHPRAITRIVLPWRRDLIHAYRGNDPMPFDPQPPEPEPDPEPEPPAPAPQPEPSSTPSSTPSDAPARVLIRRERLLLAAFRPGVIPIVPRPRTIQTRNSERPRGRSPPPVITMKIAASRPRIVIPAPPVIPAHAGIQRRGEHHNPFTLDGGRSGWG